MSVDILDRVYDAYTGEMGQLLMRETQRRVHWICGATSGEAVLDVGCSQGLVPILLGREGKHVVGIDSSAEAIRIAEQHLVAEPVGVRRRVTFVEGDVVTHSFGSERFDTIVMGEVLEHLLQPERLLDVAARLLEPGARLVVTVPFGINDHVDHKRTFYLAEPIRLLSTHFDVVETVVLGKWLGLIGIRRTSEAPVSQHVWSDGQVNQLELAFHAAERSLVDDLSTARSRLEEANAKYRAVSEENARLKREAAHAEHERKFAERAKLQMEEQLLELRNTRSVPEQVHSQELLRRQEELEVLRIAVHRGELGLARLEERLAHGTQVRELELSVRDSEIARLQRDRSSLEAQLEDFTARTHGELKQHEETVSQLQRELAAQGNEADARSREAAHLRQQLDAVNLRLADLSQQRTSLETALAGKESQLTELGAKIAELEAALALERDIAKALRGELLTTSEASARDAEALAEARVLLAEQQTARDALSVARHQLESLERTQDDLQRLAQALERDLKDAREAKEVTEEELAATRRQRDAFEQDIARAREQVNILDRELEGERQQRTNQGREMEALRVAAHDSERKAHQARQQVMGATQAERRALQRLEQERRGRADAERKVLQTRNTLSFQLGYRLIHGFKSPERLRSLPGALWELNKEASRRRAERERALPRGNGEKRAELESASDAARETPTNAMPGAHAPLESAHRAPVRPAPPSSKESSSRVTPPYSERTLPNLDAGLAQLRVASIHDEFTFSSFAPECRLLALSPERFVEELETFDPQLLFVESAWRGKDDLWGKKVSHRGRELVEVVEWCRARGIPTVFWNKEDPVHFATFLNTAKLFDVVFTTDVDCVERYQSALGHDRVFLLPFACQPSVHNPLEKYERKDAICFAGAYYARYPERQADLASFAGSFTAAPRLEIFDRNYGKADPSYAFPAEYQPHIVGTLPFNEIDRAYKGYRYALNLNSIKHSQSMFARRVFELLGCNTTTVSNFSRGVHLLFGDLVITTDSGPRALERIRELASDESRARRLRLLALRKVLKEHTYGARLRFIASRVWNTDVPTRRPKITVVARAQSLPEATAVLRGFTRQTFADKFLLLITPASLELPPGLVPPSARLMTDEAIQGERVGHAVAGTTYVATLVPHDYYGPNYLTDLAFAADYADAVAFGKVARFVAHDATLALSGDGAQYRFGSTLSARCALIRADALGSESLVTWLRESSTRTFEHPRCLAIDEFNYCMNGAELSPQQLEPVDDLTGVDTGVSIQDLTRPGTGVTSRSSTGAPRQITAERLAAVLRPPAGKPFTLSLRGGLLEVHSTLPDESHEYVYANKLWKPDELGFPQSNKFRLEAGAGLNLNVAFLFLDDKKQRVGHRVCPASRNEVVMLPENTAFIQLGLRIYGSGSTQISGLLLDHKVETPARIFGRADYLVLTNHYPSDDDLYRNAFVHRRVLDYARQGARIDVFRYRAAERLSYREFEGVHSISGGGEALETLLRSNDYKAVLVHFLEPAMWRALRQYAPNARPLIWLHGAEVQAWHRRSFNHASEAERSTARVKSEARDDFWRSVLRELPEAGRLIFVSRQFKDQTLGDLGLPTEHPQCTVIHNLIDGELFKYERKSPEQRKRILSIRPYVSRKYANDLSVSAILELAKRPYFDQLVFHLIGDGPLFEETVAPLRGFANVTLERGFLTQQQIAELHRSYGVFLCPTRDDTQGVSRDEAMASGLVPLTNAVSAVPEFVDDSCAILARPENHQDLAAGVARLFEEPSLFAQLSERAAQRVRRQSSATHTTQRELQIIRGPVADAGVSVV